jgi:hypothetical protein
MIYLTTTDIASKENLSLHETQKMSDSNATAKQASGQPLFSLNHKNINKKSMLRQIVPVTDLAELCVTMYSNPLISAV